MTRLGTRNPETFTEEETAEYESLLRQRPARADGSLGGPFDAMLLSPGFSHRSRSLGYFLWEKTTLHRSMVELAITTTAQVWQSNVEWGHSKRAIEYGIAPEVVEAVKQGAVPAEAPEDQRVLLEICFAMQKDRKLERPLYDRGVQVFGEKGLVELMGVIGYYTMIAMVLTAVQVEPPADGDAPFPRKSD